MASLTVVSAVVVASFVAVAFCRAAEWQTIIVVAFLAGGAIALTGGLFITIAAFVVASRPSTVSGMRLVAWPSFVDVAAARLLASTLVASRPRFLDVVA